MTAQLTDGQVEVIEAFFAGVYHEDFTLTIGYLELACDPQLIEMRGQPNAAAFMDKWEEVFDMELWQEHDDRDALTQLVFRCNVLEVTGMSYIESWKLADLFGQHFPNHIFHIGRYEDTVTVCLR